MVAAGCGVIFAGLVDLHRRILSVNLPFDEILQMFRDADIKPDLIGDASDLETEVFLDTTAHL